jgi:hypothetical protein
MGGFSRPAAALLFGILGLSTAASAQVAATKKADNPLGAKFYATAELRHHLNTYYDSTGYYAHQEPSTHARIQAGAQLYEGFVDVYGTLGVFKIPRTQQVMQRRPELAADVHLLQSEYATIMQYNIVQFPIREEAAGPMAEDDKTDGFNAGVVYTLGLTPTVKWPIPTTAGKGEVKLGADGWTRVYSRRQYTEDYGPAFDGEDDGTGRDGLGLAPEGEDAGPGTDAEPIEDYAPHYQAQVFAGGSFASTLVRGSLAEVTGHYHSRFDPRYEVEADESVDYEYAVDRYSYYRVRLRYEINERLSVTNDFYHFHEGMFEAKRKGDERRFRNIARVSCRL